MDLSTYVPFGVETFWSLVPPILTIILAIWTKEVILSLFVGVYLGGLMLAGWNPLYGLRKMFSLLNDPHYEMDDPGAYDTGVFSNPENIQIIILVCMLGGLIGLIIKTGGSQAFADFLGRKIKSKKGAQLMCWGLGLIIFFDDYFNAMTNGNVMRPVTDKFGISREKLSYIVDSTSVGICLVSPISSWVAFLCGLIATEFAKNPEYADENSFVSFIKCIPYNYYAILSIIMVLVVILFKLDFGPMAKAERRAETTGRLYEATFGQTSAAEEGEEEEGDDYSSIKPANGGAIMLIAPIILLILLALTFILWTGGFFGGASLIDTINNMDGMVALISALCITSVVTIIWAALARTVNILDSLAAWVVGVKSMTYVCILLALAWTLGAVCEEMGTATFLVGLLGNAPKAIIILLMFAIACILTFTTGAAFATYPIMIPIAVPIAFATGVSPYAMVACIIGGGGFGNHASPLADTCILSSSSSNVRHTDHVKTQVPYSSLCAASAAVGYIFSGIMGDNFLVPLIITFAVFLGLLIILSLISKAGAKKEDAKANA